jgi:hypothetical protein
MKCVSVGSGRIVAIVGQPSQPEKTHWGWIAGQNEAQAPIELQFHVEGLKCSAHAVGNAIAIEWSPPPRKSDGDLGMPL